MDQNEGYEYSWSGFLDYYPCFHKLTVFEIVYGTAVLLGTCISLIPQLTKIVNLRSSRGISPLFVFLTSAAQGSVVVNYFCLHTADFYSITQIPASITIPRFLSFMINFFLWFLYAPVGLMALVFSEEQSEKHKISKERILQIICALFVVFFPIGLFVAYLCIGIHHNYSCSGLDVFARLLGVFSSILSIIQYSPQFITTFKLKDSGSLSLTTLFIQSPGGMASVIFTAFVNKEDWSFWVPMLCSNIQQWGLLFLCIFYKIRARRLKKKLVSGITTESSSFYTQGQNVKV